MVKAMKLSAGLVLLALLAVSPEVRYFQYERPVQKSSGQSCMVLDAGIFSHAAPQLADLRLYHDGAETPFALPTAAPVASVERSISPLNLGVRAGQTVFDAALPEGRYSDLQLAVTGQNFIASVTVSGGQEETGSAETRIGTYTIFDLTGQKLGRSTVLHLPESDFRYLHFRIKGPISPESVTGLTVMRLPSSQPKYVVVAENSQGIQKGHSSRFQFSVPAHVPVDQVVFVPSASPTQFSRDVTIAVTSIPPSPVSDAVQPPRTVAFHGNLLRVHGFQAGQRIDEERLAVDAPWVDFSTPAKWEITIENGDDAPLALQSVRLQMIERDLCFDADGSGTYMLYYGDPALEAPRYDYAKLFALQANASRIEAGPEDLNPGYQPRPDSRPFTEKHPALLWMALIAVIALLGVVAVRSAKPAAPFPK
jgi:hypothetical protein